jgi:hypothetical protein
MPTVTITSASLPSPLVCKMGTEAPMVTDGYADYELIDRPKRKQAINWKGTKAIVETVNLLFDGYREDQSVEGLCVALERLVAPANANKLLQPSTVKLSGPIPHSDYTWVISGIEWLDVIYHEAGFRCRQFFTLTLTEYVELNEIINNDVKQNKIRYRIVTVRKGYDLRQIAAIMMGDSSLWRRIENIKGKKFRDPYVKPGTRVKVPII